MGRPRRADLRQALLLAAERRIDEAGLAALKARELTREVGCALGALYTAYPDLDALALAVNARTLDALEAALDAVPDGPPADRLPALALAYLDYAAAHRRRWAALFEHRMADGRAAPDWYHDRLARLFCHVEAPLAALRPGMGSAARARLARSLFSAVHGVVALGLDEKVGPMPATTLRGHLRVLVDALVTGLARPRPRR